MSDIEFKDRFIKGDYDFGDLTEGVDLDSIAEGEYNFGYTDFMYIDDEVYNFGDLETGIGTAVGDYDFGDLLEGVDPDSVADGEYNFDILSKRPLDYIRSIDGDFDFKEIITGENLKGDYNYGDIDKIGAVNEQLQKLIRDALRDVLSNGNIRVRDLRTFYNPIKSGIYVQFYYNQDTNKVFIEFDYDDNFKKLYNYDTTNITKKIIGYINSNFDYNTGLWSEIVLIEDDKIGMCDEYINLTPYTIGYWKSLSGPYKFLTDKAQIQQDSCIINYPSFEEEYKQKREEIVKQYLTSDFQLMTDKVYELDEEYNISLDQKPDKSFNDYINAVKTIISQYKQPYLSEEDKMNYINEYNELYSTYKDTEEFKDKLEELYNKYGLISNLNQYVPELFELYNQIYYQFFGKILPCTSEGTFKYFYEVVA